MISMCLQFLMKFHHCVLKILRKNQNFADGRENCIPPTQTQFAGVGGTIMIQTWNTKPQKRAAEFWQMVRNENTAKNI